MRYVFSQVDTRTDRDRAQEALSFQLLLQRARRAGVPVSAGCGTEHFTTPHVRAACRNTAGETAASFVDSHDTARAHRERSGWSGDLARYEARFGAIPVHGR